MSAIFSRKIRFKDNAGREYPEWHSAILADLFDERSERANGNEELLAVTINSGVVKRDEIELKDNSSKDKSNYKKVLKDDIAYNTMRMWQGASGVSEYNGIVSPAYTIVYLREPHKNNIGFWGYYFKTTKLINAFQRNSQGLTSDTWNLKYPQFEKIAVLVPCYEEQCKIVDFLDILQAEIGSQEKALDTLIRQKKSILNVMFI